VTLREALAIVRRWWWLIVAGLVVGVAGAFAISSQLTPIYRAQATVLVNQAQNPNAVTYSDILTSQQVTKTYAILARSKLNLDRAVKVLNDPSITVEVLDRIVSATDVPGTQLLRISAEDSSPTRAALIANATASVFPQFVQDAQLAGRASDRPLNAVVVAETATAPSSPVRPNKTLYMVLGGLLGLAVAGAAIAVMEYFDEEIDDQEDLEALGMPVLGSVFLAEAPKGVDKHRWVPSLLQESTDNSLVESYRQIQAGLAFALGASDTRVLLVASANPGEGKSTTAANMGQALAESSRRVLLIDGDLRKPDLHRYFSLSNSSGLSSSFLAEVQAAGSFVNQISPRLSVMTSGPIPPNSAELLSSRKLQAIIEVLRHEYDLIVIDTPPLIGLADASLWLAVADGVLVVSRRRKTRRAQLRQALAVLRASNVPIVGAVLNGTRRRRDGYYYYRYGYGYDRSGRSR
jgi:capsular exopolysaccharide synthesis family protein